MLPRHVNLELISNYGWTASNISGVTPAGIEATPKVPGILAAINPPLRDATMPNTLRSDLHHVDETSFDYIFESNASIKLGDGRGIVRCNVYRAKLVTKSPVLVTYRPYGRDIHYSA